MDSISFDFAADFYDDTRGFPEGIGARIAESLLSALGVSPRILEVGIGTGRIARPLVEVSAYRDGAIENRSDAKSTTITGADISPRMLSKLRSNLGSRAHLLSLVLGSSLSLPFTNNSFDAVLMVHLIHLIRDWKAALMDCRRVLVDGGSFFIGGETSEPYNPSTRLRKALHQLILECYPSYPVYGPADAEERNGWFANSGAIIDTWEAASWVVRMNLGKTIDTFARGIHSATWRLPPDVRTEVIHRLQLWAVAEFGSLDVEIDVPRRFVWERYRWNPPSG